MDISILILPFLLIFIFLVDGFESSIRWLAFATVLVAISSALYYIAIEYFPSNGKKVFAITIFLSAIIFEYYKWKRQTKK